jgi:hypothetical protein
MSTVLDPNRFRCEFVAMRETPDGFFGLTKELMLRYRSESVMTLRSQPGSTAR